MLKKKNKLIFYTIPFFLGIITSFSLPPYNLFWLNFFTFPCFLIFFLSNFNNDKWRSFIIGWLFGFGYFVSNIYWITNSLTFEEIFKPLIPIALLIIPLFLGLFYALATFTLSFFALNKNYSTILIFAIIFSLFEFTRGIVLGGFPWNLIAYSWSEYTSFLQVLSLIGTYSFNLLAITFFLIPSIIFFNKSLSSKILLIFFSIFLFSANHYYGKSVIKKYNKIKNIDLKTTIKVISPRINMNRFFQDDDSIIIVKELIELSHPDSRDTVFIFPEGILSNIYLEDLKIYQTLFEESFSKNHKILLGISSYENSKIYNSMVLLDNNLNILAKYNKNKLVPFGEFLPFENIFSKLGFKKITQGYQSFSPGADRNIIEINNIKFLPLICYEIIYSGKLNEKNKEFNFILNISEDGWFGNSIGPYQHFSHSIYRSIEEGKNLIRSANNGISVHINPVGEIIRKIETTHKGVIEIKSFKKTHKTIFSKEGNKIFFYFLIFYIILIFFLKKKIKR